jgi:2-polyprenyl-3-methyl-5-hydroxy-6-metoxy-1,4-benzoquinol methylase
MDERVAQELLALNHRFYQRFAAPFASSRSRPQPGYSELLKWLPQPCKRLLDVGCGDGRLERFIRERRVIDEYVGVDFSSELLEMASADGSGVFKQRDLSAPGSLRDTGAFDAIACLATLQHIPGRERRQRLVVEMAQHLKPEGRVLLSNWQFLESERQRSKLAEWSQMGLHDADVEPGDYLMTWRREGFGLRYVSYIDSSEILALATKAGLVVLHEFRSDGREGNLNLYTICVRLT